MSDYGGTFTVGDTTFWVGHRAYLELEVVVGANTPFLFRGDVVGGNTEQRWVGEDPEFGELIPDPSQPDRISSYESENLLDELRQIGKIEGQILVDGTDVPGVSSLSITVVPGTAPGH